MANPEHLQILQQGVEAWNQWRDRHRDIRPDLCDAPLRDAKLRDANFRDANLMKATLAGATLRDANLMKADLTGANLTEAILTRADLTEATLTEATLFETDLARATLIGATLIGATLIWAHFANANLTGADVSQAHLFSTVFGDTNLTGVRGLETCQHYGPSILDHRTIVRSGPLHLAFLRGCGLPDVLIKSLPSLLNEPPQYYSCFISHASQDRAFTERLHADLQNKGVRCWFDKENMKIGDRLRLRIDEMIYSYDKCLVILSKRSVASQWVEQEVETALARERQQGTTILFPVRIDNTVMTLETGWPAYIRNTRNIGDFLRWETHSAYRQAFDQLLRNLKAEARKPDAST
jgi:TIR domain/Pentapeptide repeats (8 copies)